MTESIILFGDSITAGYVEGEITRQLTDKVQKAFPNDIVRNAGIPGDTTVNAIERVDPHVLRYNPTIVTLFFGINDLSSDRELTINIYEKNMIELIDTIGPERLILITPPYTKQSLRQYDRPTERILEYTDLVSRLAERYSIPSIHLYDAMIATEHPDELLQEDGLHFSSAGYELLASLINDKIQTYKTE